MKIRNMFLKSLLVVSLVGASLACQSQTWKQDLKLIQQKFREIGDAEVTMTYRWYEQDSLIEALDGKVVALGQDQYSQIGEIELIACGSYLLTVDHESKLMVLQHDPEQMKQLGILQTISWDSLAHSYKDVSHKRISDDIHCYRFRLKPEKIVKYSAIELWYDPQGFELQKLLMLLQSPGKEEAFAWLEIDIKEIVPLAANRANRFTIDHFLRKPYSSGKLQAGVSSYQFEYLSSQQ